jgi:hypothetical protein
MRSALIAVAAIFLLPPRAHGGVSLENGFYPHLRGISRHKVTTQDGEKLKVGARVEPDVKYAKVWSLDNRNEVFLVSVVMPGYVGSSWHVLVVGGTAFKQHSSSALGKAGVQVRFMIRGRKEAEQAASHLSIKPRYRKHPGHRLAVEFVPAKATLDVGESTVVAMTIENVGTETVYFKKGGMNRAPRDNQYTFVARHMGKQVEDIGDDIHFGGGCGTVALKRGESFRDTADLSKWFRFAKPGTYQMLGSYYMAFRESDSRDASYWIAWEDYATASFTVTVRKPKDADLEPTHAADAAVNGDGGDEGE